MKECFVCGRCFGDHNLDCDIDKTTLKTTLLGLPIIKNRYRLDRRINTEAFGTTYLAYDIETKSKVTLKIILLEYLQSDPETYLKTLEDIKQINHPNIISIFNYGKNDETSLFIVTEHLEYKTLERALKEQKVLPLEQAINYISLLCEIINAIYDTGQMYQDIKLTNILVGNNLKLSHLGIVFSIKPRSTGTVLDLPFYISPEQCKNIELDERSEVYSLGVLLYHLVTGKIPFSGQNYTSIAEQHIRQVPVDPSTIRPEIPKNIAAIILRALEKDPDKRFQSVLAFANLLRQAFRQANKIENSQPIGVDKPSTEKLAIASTSPKDLLKEAKNLRASMNPQVLELEDANRTVEVTSFESVKQNYSTLAQVKVPPLENDPGLTQPGVQFFENDSSLIKAQELITNPPEINQAPSHKPKRFSTISIIRDNDDNKLKDSEKSLSFNENVSNNEAALRISNDDILTSLSSKLAEKTYPLSDIQDSTKPLPPELQVLYNKVSSLSESQENLIQESVLKVKEVEEVLNKGNLNSDSSENLIPLSPTQICYFYANKVLPTYKVGQYQRILYDGVIVEREALASLVLILAIFSLKKRKCLKIVALDKIPTVLQQKLTFAEDDKVVLQIINAGVKPLDSLEQSISKSFGRLNAISLYSLYEYFFLIADKQKIAISELINDAAADDLMGNKLLKVIPRNPKTHLEPGGSIRSYVVNIAEGSYLSQYNDLVKNIEELKREVLSLGSGSQVKLYSYMFDYYKRLFCEHSYAFER
ncbi:MAG: serine/threonine protein kinase [Acidobacteria bacterium]|nr:serine/threonine protein kinase [Acidobacteriota bacterium]